MAEEPIVINIFPIKRRLYEYLYSKEQDAFVVGRRGAVGAALLFRCGNGGVEWAEPSSNGGGTPGPSLSYGGHTYKTVVINGKTWMAENLNIETSSGSWCYDDNRSNCETYGRLYDWETAKSACPTGWHLPSRAEWDQLVTTAGGSSVAGSKLKSTSGWYNSGNGTDEYGFSALPGGLRDPNGHFDGAGYGGIWWTGTEYGGSDAYIRDVDYSKGQADEDHDSKDMGFSVRCVIGNGGNVVPPVIVEPPDSVIDGCDSNDPTIGLVGSLSITLKTNNGLSEFRKYMHFDGGDWQNIITWTNGGGKTPPTPAEPCLMVNGVCKTVFSTEEKNALPAPGAYQIKYRVEKDMCNGKTPLAEVVRSIIIETYVAPDIGTPVIVLRGPNPMEIRAGGAYTELGCDVTVNGVNSPDALDSVVVTGTNSGNTYRLKVTKPINFAAVVFPTLADGSTYSITYYASYKGADMPSAATDSKVRSVSILADMVGPKPAVIVLKPYKHKLSSGKDVYYPDTVLVFGATDDNYVEKGVDSAYYMSGGEKMMLDNSSVAITRQSPFITGQDNIVARWVNYEIPAGSGYGASHIRRNVFLVDRYCEDGNIPPAITFLSSSSSTIDAGKVWDYNGSWAVANKDELGGQGFKFFIDFDGLNPNNPVAGTYTLTYVGLGKCGGRTERAREITVR